jgi:hypothetical protein
MYNSVTRCIKDINTRHTRDGEKQEGHDGPEVAYLYIAPRSGASLNPWAFIWTNLEDTH